MMLSAAARLDTEASVMLWRWMILEMLWVERSWKMKLYSVILQRWTCLEMLELEDHAWTSSPSTMNNILAFFIFSFLSGVVLGGWCDRDDWYGKRHFAIADKINNIRRRDYGLPALECHWSLVQTATAHSKNQQDVPTPDASECNPHSWLSKNHLGKKGVTCCFPRDGDGCMWNKPEEIAGRNAIGGGDGYEITLGPSNGDMTADEAIKAWSKSARHKAVFTAQGKWKKWNLTKIGCFYIGNWANCWFSA